MSTTDATKEPRTILEAWVQAVAKATPAEQPALAMTALVALQAEVVASNDRLATSHDRLAEVLENIQAQDAKRDEAFAALAKAVDQLGSHINRIASAAQESMERARERAAAMVKKAAAEGMVAAGVPVVRITR